MERPDAFISGRVPDHAALSAIENLARYARQQGNTTADDLLTELLAVLAESRGPRASADTRRRVADSAGQPRMRPAWLFKARTDASAPKTTDYGLRLRTW
jgi:hypothetical protein